MRLAELQHRVRCALVQSNGALPPGVFRGGAVPARRFDIHRRHYEHSLTTAIAGRFPATGWLIGATRLDAAARAFVHASPPTAPCLAEYGTAFPAFLAGWPETAHMAYLCAFAELDWHLGRVAVSIDMPAVHTDGLARIDVDGLPDMTVTLQPGTHYLHTAWGVDALMQMHLTDSVPASWTLEAQDLHLEVRGARGTFRFVRRAAPEFAFRASLARGDTYGDAADLAIAHDAAFDPGRALVALARDSMIVAVAVREGAR